MALTIYARLWILGSSEKTAWRPLTDAATDGTIGYLSRFAPLDAVFEIVLPVPVNTWQAFRFILTFANSPQRLFYPKDQKIEKVQNIP